MQIRPHPASRSTHDRGSHLRRAALLLAVGLVAVACGGSDDETTTAAVASLDETTTVTDDPADEAPAERTDEEAMLAFSQCVRDNGVAEFTDPTTDADGNVSFDLFGSGIEIGTDTFDSAVEACQFEVEGLNIGGGQGIDQTEVEDVMLDFTECLRSEGLDVGDFTFPDAGGPPAGGGEDGGFELSGSRNDLLAAVLGLDADDPAVEAAIETCEPLLAGLGQPGAA
ncbi:MAG: hypothetical protein AAF480_00930 [Actinomycetota bacterium]